MLTLAKTPPRPGQYQVGVENTAFSYHASPSTPPSCRSAGSGVVCGYRLGRSEGHSFRARPPVGCAVRLQKKEVTVTKVWLA